jgi:hypothetical protein
MLQLGMACDRADQERPIHHLSEHGIPPNSSMSRRRR